MEYGKRKLPGLDSMECGGTPCEALAKQGDDTALDRTPTCACNPKRRLSRRTPKRGPGRNQTGSSRVAGHENYSHAERGKV